MARQIRFNAFDMNCVGHQSPGLWAHPRDKSFKYKDLDYWQDLARTLERGVFDGIFIADVIGYYDVYKGSNYHAIHQAAQIPVNDPLQLAAPIALATKHLGIGITASTSFEHPYTFARRLATADHHSKGRVGWNIVTSYLESGAKNVRSLLCIAISSGDASGPMAPRSLVAGSCHGVKASRNVNPDRRMLG